ncbi:hypothetical protein Acsp06_43630 [Actinomycetospora sp. NBRC 106375]|nr:hypothetical protein Acsp06_43630 [Actinomycetospora sp. NBRC 106375]
METLRARCATDVDGTSIDALELVIGELGLPCEQVVVPVDHLVRAAAAVLPAVVVVELPDGATHFVVIWRRLSRGRLEIMDPAQGRRVVAEKQFVSQVYRHRLSVPLEAWFAWASGEQGRGALLERLVGIGVDELAANATVSAAVASGPDDLSTLDAAVRVAARLREASALPAAKVGAFVDRLAAHPEDLDDEDRSMRRLPPAPDGDDEEELVEFRGGVAVRVTGAYVSTASPARHGETGATTPGTEAPARSGPWRAALSMLWPWRSLRWALAAAVLAGAGVVGEALALRDVVAGSGRGFWLAVAVVLGEVLVGWAGAAAARRAGRGLEQDLRARWSQRLGAVAPWWVATRPASDLVERVHGLHRARNLPWLLCVAARAAATGLTAVVAVLWLIPQAVPALAGLVALPVLGVRWGWSRVAELDLRSRTIAGVLSRYLLDGLLGLSTLAHHDARTALRWEQGRSLAQWQTASTSRVRASALLEAAIGLAVLLPAAAALGWVATMSAPVATKLMLLLLILSVPVAIDEIITVGRLLPDARNRLLRFRDLLDATTESTPTSPVTGEGPMPVYCDQVSVQRGGTVVIDQLTLDVPAEQRVAVLGRSGSAKSTLLDAVVGLAELVAGAVHVGPTRVADDPAAVRRRAVWLTGRTDLWDRDPDTNISLPRPPSREIIDAEAARVGADKVLSRLADARDRPVGPGGRRLSGGEGQLLRAARTVVEPEPGHPVSRPGARTDVGLVIADEATRGLDAPARERLLSGLLEAHPRATVLWATHDPTEARRFDRVVVMEAGRIIEDGTPDELAARPDGHFAALLCAHHDAAHPPGWRRADLEAAIGSTP